MKIHPILLLAALVAANPCAGGLQTIQVPSAAMNRSIATSVVLPRGYAETDAARPVLYLLHGAGDDERTWCTRTPVQEMADLHGVIVVSPAAGTSWYFDSHEDKSSQFETFVAAELVKHVDAHYRTITNRAGRALAGNSMGGHGAMFLAARHPDVFCAAAPMSGGMDIRASDPQVGSFPENWGIKQHLGRIQAHPGRWDEHTVINVVDGLTNGELAISIDCGAGDFFLAVNRQLHAKLNARGIAHDYAEHPGHHNWDYWRVALTRQMAFLSRHLQAARAPASVPAPGDADYPQPSPSARHTEKVKAVKSGRYDLVLIGDSITHTLGELPGKYDPLRAVWEKHFAPRRAINLGHNGYRTENILWNLLDGELDFQESPKLFLLLIGTNNADHRHFPRAHTPGEILAGTRAIVDLIRQRHPASRILILRIFPKGMEAQRSEATSPPVFTFDASDVEAARRAGELTRQLADDRHVFWLDVNQVFLRPDGQIDTGMMWDLLHPSPAGAEAWAQAIEPTLNRLMDAGKEERK